MKNSRNGMRLIAIVIIGAIMSGCAIYANVGAPLDLNLDKTDLGTKVGRADAYSILWLFAWGDASYAAAARNGNIKVLKHADQHLVQAILGLYVHWQVIVYGD